MADEFTGDQRHLSQQVGTSWEEFLEELENHTAWDIAFATRPDELGEFLIGFGDDLKLWAADRIMAVSLDYGDEDEEEEDDEEAEVNIGFSTK